jgi:DNA-binding NarL/FixJ family response regulator
VSGAIGSHAASPSPLHRVLALAEGPGSAEERLERIRSELRSIIEPPAAGTALTKRQLATLMLLAQGLSNRAVARRLEIGEETVKSHVKALLERLNLNNRTALVLWAIRQGLVSAYSDARGSEAALSD